MLTFKKFAGINNVKPTERLKPTEQSVALNVDFGVDSEARRRKGFTVRMLGSWENVWQADGFILATLYGDLTSFTEGPPPEVTLLYSSISHDRIWYVNLPDGRTAFSNGLINGITDGSTVTGWGVPVPSSVGDLTDVAGSLYPGDYQWQITYVRDNDGAEGGAAYSNPTPVALGGVVLTGLPELEGYSINVYLTGANGDQAFFAGNTTNGMFSYTGTNDALVLPCRTNNLYPAPLGTVSTMWRGRALVAVGNVLYASKNGQYELFDLRRDFKQFTSAITLLVSVDDGLYVGTSTELAFLHGTEFDKLVYKRVVDGPVVLGSGVPVRGERVMKDDGVGDGSAMLCIADYGIVAGFNGGAIVRMTQGVYEADVSEVWATFRDVDGTPQYIAVIKGSVNTADGFSPTVMGEPA